MWMRQNGNQLPVHHTPYTFDSYLLFIWKCRKKDTKLKSCVLLCIEYNLALGIWSAQPRPSPIQRSLMKQTPIALPKTKYKPNDDNVVCSVIKDIVNDSAV